MQEVSWNLLLVVFWESCEYFRKKSVESGIERLKRSVLLYAVSRGWANLLIFKNRSLFECRNELQSLWWNLNTLFLEIASTSLSAFLWWKTSLLTQWNKVGSPQSLSSSLSFRTLDSHIRHFPYLSYNLLIIKMKRELPCSCNEQPSYLSLSFQITITTLPNSSIIVSVTINHCVVFWKCT